jgi:uncharacterized membrane protein
MTLPLLVALGLGVVAGLRAFTPLAALSFARGPLWGTLGAVLALVEYVMDVLPTTPARTAPQSLVLRLVSGGFCGWVVTVAGGTGTGIAGVVLGVIGALAGTFGGHALRVRAIAKIGTIPSGIVEDAIAIALAAFLITR